jgi:hypothetical protein
MVFVSFGCVTESDLLEAQKNLVNLKIVANARLSIDFDYGSVFRSCQKTITDITILLNCMYPMTLDCSELQNCRNLASITMHIVRTGVGLELQGNRNQQRSLFLNLHKLPKGIRKLTLSQMVEDYDANWIAKNLLELEQLTYSQVESEDEFQRTLEQFLLFLTLPKFKEFRIGNFKCPRISRFVEASPGLSNRTGSDFETHVIVDRNLFKIQECGTLQKVVPPNGVGHPVAAYIRIRIFRL